MIKLPYLRFDAGKIHRWALGGVVAAALLAAPAEAQGNSRGKNRGIPRQGQGVPSDYRPPAGLCRIWLDGVPAGQQPAPTDCTTAVRNRPVNGRVIFGDDGPGKGKSKKSKGLDLSTLIPKL